MPNTANVSSYTPRMQAAFTRADESIRRLQRVAIALSEEIDEVTAPHGVPVMDLDPEDSMVIAVERVMDSRPARPKTNGG
jgi:hypothetical protein